MSIDAKGRALQPTPSFLQAWNLVETVAPSLIEDLRIKADTEHA